MLDSMGTTKTAAWCVLGKRMWRLLVEDQGNVARAQDRDAQRWSIVRMSFREGCRRGAPCQGGRLEGCSKFPLPPHSPIS